MTQEWEGIAQAILNRERINGWEAALNATIELREFVDTLDPRQSRFLLMVLEGYTYAEIAPKIGLSIQLTKYLGQEMAEKIERHTVRKLIDPMLSKYGFRNRRNRIARRMRAARERQETVQQSVCDN